MRFLFFDWDFFNWQRQHPVKGTKFLSGERVKNFKEIFHVVCLAYRSRHMNGLPVTYGKFADVTTLRRATICIKI